MPGDAVISGYGVIGIDYTVKHIAVKPYSKYGNSKYGNLVSLCGRFSLRPAVMNQAKMPVCKWCVAAERIAPPPSSEHFGVVGTGSNGGTE